MSNYPEKTLQCNLAKVADMIEAGSLVHPDILVVVLRDAAHRIDELEKEVKRCQTACCDPFLQTR